MGLEEAKDALAQAAATLGELAEELPPNLRHPWKDVIETDLLRPLEQRVTRLHTVLDPIAMSESTSRLKMGRGAGLKAGSLLGRAKPSCAQVPATRLTRGRLLHHAATGCVAYSHPSRVEPPALLLENLTQIDPDHEVVVVDIEGRSVTYEFGELDEVALAYTATVHKSQGSEYPAVVMPLSTQHYPMLERNLLYTGVTRGKQLVVLIGQPRALGLAVRTVKSLRRLTNLSARLRQPCRDSGIRQG